MSLDDTLMDLWITDPYKTAYTKALPVAKEAILTDLLEIIGTDDIEVRGTTQNPDNPKYWTRKTANRNQLRQELRDKVRKYCE